MTKTLNPLRLYLAGFDWTGRTNRRQFLIMAGLSLAPVGVGRLVGIDTLDGGRLSTILTIWAALAAVPCIGHALRRLADAGRSVWLIWIALVPILNLGLLLILLFWPTNARRLAEATQLRLLGFPLGMLCALGVLSRLVLVPVVVETADMQPALVPGDIVMVWRGDRTQEIGELAVIADPHEGNPLVRRIIALGETSVEMVNGVPVIAGVAATRIPSGFHSETMMARGPLGVLPRCMSGSVGEGGECQKRILSETLPTGETYRTLDIGNSALDVMGPRPVPAGTVFVLSDNRDDATDSRIALGAGGLGMVGIADLRGRVAFVLGSFSGRAAWQVWTWGPERFLKGVS